MSRWIDVDAMTADLLTVDPQYESQINWTLQVLHAQPSIDLVRCAECKHCVNGQCWKSEGLDKLDGNVADDDFCSRGERKESE